MNNPAPPIVPNASCLQGSRQHRVVQELSQRKIPPTLKFPEDLPAIFVSSLRAVVMDNLYAAQRSPS